MRDAENSELHEGSGRSGGVTAPKLSEIEKAIADLKELLKPGDTVYTKVDHVSRSGMTRWIEVYVFRNDEPRNLSWLVSKVTGFGFGGQHSGVKVGGCGMDMGFHVVYSLSRVLYGPGYECIQDKESKTDCPSNYHVNARDWTKYEGQHTDGYALRHRWL